MEINMLLILHADVLRYILHDWLKGSDIAILDTAICNKLVRKQYLSCLQGKEMSFKEGTAKVVEKYDKFVAWCNMKSTSVCRIVLRFCGVGFDAITWKNHSNTLSEFVINEYEYFRENEIYQFVRQPDEWNNHGYEQKDVGELLQFLPFLKTLLFNVRMLATFIPPKHPFSLHLERFTINTPMKKIPFRRMVVFLGQYAKKLKYLEMFCHRYDDFPDIVKYLVTVEELHCEFHREERLIAHETLLFPDDFLDTAITCPNFHKVKLEKAPEELLLPFLWKCICLEDVTIGVLNTPSQQFATVLAQVLPRFKKYKLYGKFMELCTDKLFATYPFSSRLEDLHIIDVSDQTISTIPCKFPSLVSLTIVSGEMLNGLSLLYSCPGRLRFLKDLCIENVLIPDIILSACFAKLHIGCPALQKLTFSFPDDFSIVPGPQTTEHDLFFQLLQSPLHHQLTHLFVTSSQFTVQEEDPRSVPVLWESIPVWSRLKSASFYGLPGLYPLSEWFQRTPNLQHFVLGTNLLSYLGPCDDTCTDMQYLTLCVDTFQRVPKLRYLGCAVASTTESRITLDFWIALISTCTSLEVLEVLYEGDHSYWDQSETLHFKETLTQMFRDRVSLRMIHPSDEDKIV